MALSRADSQDLADLERPLLSGGSHTTADTPSSKKRVTLVSVILCLVVVNTTFSLSAPIYPQLVAAWKAVALTTPYMNQEAARHGVGATAVGFIFSSFSFLNFIASLAFGRLLQRQLLGRRQLLVCGIVVLAVGTAVFGLVAQLPTRASFIGVCLALRLVEGVACAAVDTSATAITAALYKDSPNFGVIMGTVEATVSIGWVIGPVVGGTLADLAGFGAPFYLVGALALAFTPGAWLLLPADEPHPPRQSASKPTSIWSLLAHPPISILLLTAGIAAAMLTWGDPVLSPHLEAIGFTRRGIGFAFGLQAIVYAVFSPLAGWVSDRVGRYPIICSGLLLCGAACVLLGPAPFLPLPSASHNAVWAAMFLLGLGAAGGFVPITPAILKAAQIKVGTSEAGLEDLVSGAISGTFYLGCGGGPVLGGILTDAIGFAWTASIFGAVIATQAILVGLLVCGMRSSLTARGDLQQADTDALLGERTIGRRLSLSHDTPRANRGGLAAPSWDLSAHDVRSLLPQDSQ